MKEYKVDGTCNMHRREVKCIWYCIWKTCR